MHILTPNEAGTIYSATDAASAGFQRSGKYPNIREYLYNVYMYVYSSVGKGTRPSLGMKLLFAIIPRQTTLVFLWEFSKKILLFFPNKSEKNTGNTLQKEKILGTVKVNVYFTCRWTKIKHPSFYSLQWMPYGYSNVYTYLFYCGAFFYVCQCYTQIWNVMMISASHTRTHTHMSHIHVNPIMTSNVRKLNFCTFTLFLPS